MLDVFCVAKQIWPTSLTIDSFSVTLAVFVDKQMHVVVGISQSLLTNAFLGHINYRWEKNILK